jgi:NADPH2:quinone reductase
MILQPEWAAIVRGSLTEEVVMKKIVVNALGGPEQLRLESSDDPTPGANEILAKVDAAGINYVDVYHRKGIYTLPLPFTPGLEGTGRIIAIGDGIKGHAVGDRIAWLQMLGSYSEKVIVPAAQIISLPASLATHDGLLFQAVTAQYLIAEYRHIQKNDVVLVHSAAGGVGQLLVQWAKHLGATVIGTTSNAAKADTVRALGADHVIDYVKTDFQTELMKLTRDRGANIVFDAVGKDTFARSVASLAHGGTAVSYGAASGPAPAVDPASLMKKALRVAAGSIFGYIADPEQLQARAKSALDGIREGWLTLGQVSTYALADASRAHTDIESRKTQGKLALMP